MASETLGADEPPRTRHRWDENSKVYSRKFYRKNKTNHKNLDSSATTTVNSAAVVCDTGEINKKSNSNCSNDAGNSNLKDGNVISSNFANGIAADNSSSYKDDSKNNESLEKENEDVGQKLSSSPPRTSASPKTPVVEEANVLQPQKDCLRLGDGSGDSPQPQQDSLRLGAVSGDPAQPQQECPGLEAASGDSPQHQQDSLILDVASGDSPQHQQDSLRLGSASGDSPQHQQDSLRLGAASGDSAQPQQVALRLGAAPGDSAQPQQDSLRLRAASGDSSQRHRDSLRLRVASGDSLQPRQAAPRLVLTVSGGSSSLNRVEAPVPNGHNENLANGSASRMMVTQVDDRLNISVSAARSREEVRDLKRKLVGELDQVRKMAKKLEAKEIQVSGYSSIGVERIAPVVEHLQYPANGGNEKELSGGGMRMNSETHSAGYNEPRPFRRLSVSVMDNNQHGAIGEVVEKEKRTPKANQYYRNSEFLLGKDRLPPESNKKAKSAGGKKHSGGEFDFGFRIDKKIFSKCSSLLQKIMNHKHGWVFNQPVDVKMLGLHDYFDIIKHPMDLGTVKARLTKNWYKTPREFAEDVRLTFHNALTYNPPGQDVHIMAQELLRMFEEKWPAIETEFDRKLRSEMMRDLGVPTPTSRKTYAPANVSVPMSLAQAPFHHPPSSFYDMRNLERSQSMPVRPEPRPKPSYSVGRKPVPKKPKAKDPHKRDMTFEEKQKLSTHLQSLPTEKLDAIVQIIKKRNSALSQHDDEIEVDIDNVDAETLWELDRFVTNYKKSLSKHKKRAELAQAKAAAAAAAAAAAPAVQETTPAPAHIEPPREAAATDEGNVPPSPRAQQGERHSDNNNSGSSSSSSSSSSGSSSSDSDSDSSSGSDSDGGH